MKLTAAKPVACTRSANLVNSSRQSFKQNNIKPRNFHTTKTTLADPTNTFKYRDLSKVEFPRDDFAKYKTAHDAKFDKSFTYMVVGAAGATYATLGKNVALTLVESMLPSADVLALANVEVDLTTIAEGTTATVKWRGRPLFVRHRTQEEIDSARSVSNAELPDPAADDERSKNPEWLVVIGICTHLGCVPLANQGEYGGWFCPCHGSHYDTSGRIRKGPAPKNLEIPPYFFVDDTKILVGVDKLE